jgi:hypothetical protein
MQFSGADSLKDLSRTEVILALCSKANGLKSTSVDPHNEFCGKYENRVQSGFYSGFDTEH